MSTRIIKINKQKIIKGFLILFFLPYVPIILKFIFQLGEYTGIFLRNLYYFVVFS